MAVPNFLEMAPKIGFMASGGPSDFSYCNVMVRRSASLIMFTLTRMKSMEWRSGM